MAEGARGDVFVARHRAAAAAAPAAAATPPSTLTLVSGDGQMADPGTTLPAPIVVIASDGSGHALPNRAITFAVASGGGSVSPAAVATDANGLAQTTWKLRPTVGTQTLTVSAPAVTNTVLTVSATSGKPPLLFVGVDPSYYYYYGSALPQSLGIGQYKNIWVGPSTFSPVPAPLTISLSHDGGARTSVPSTVTIPTGETFSQFTVTGTSTGADAIVASAPGYSQATFSIAVDLGTISFGVVDLPPALAVAVSKDVTICANAPDGNWVFLSAPITLSLTAGTNVKFVTIDVPGTTVTSVTIPANDNCAYLLVQGVAAGSASVTLSSPTTRRSSPPSPWRRSVESCFHS